MIDYLTEQTYGSIIRNTFRIFFRNFLPLFIIFFIPMFPFALLQLHGEHTQNVAMKLVGAAGYFLFLGLTWVAITVAVSDICVGNRPDVVRAYRRGFGRIALKVLATYVLVMAVILGVLAVAAVVVGGLAAALAGTDLARLPIVIVPLLACGVVLMLIARYMLTFQVTVLEPVWGRSAMRRSRVLGQGYYLRNLLVAGLCAIVAYVPHVLFVAIVYGMVVATLGEEKELADIALAAASLVFGPLYAVASVLLYYDMRVRKEAYNISGLLTDLTA